MHLQGWTRIKIRLVEIQFTCILPSGGGSRISRFVGGHLIFLLNQHYSHHQSIPETMPHLPVLSIDVFEAVIDQSSDHVTSLRQLSLICTAFQPRARYHLFSSICIRSVEHVHDAPAFLDTHPWIPPLVKKVSLSPGPLSGDHWYRVKNIPLLDIAPVHILSRLPNLRTWKLELAGSPLTTGGPWLSFHRSTLSCYSRYGGHIRNLELLSIPFDDLSDFTRLVSALAGIQSVSISYIRFRSDPERKPFIDHSGPTGKASTFARSLKIKSLSVSIFVCLPLYQTKG